MTSGTNTGSLNFRSLRPARLPVDVGILKVCMWSLGINNQVDLTPFKFIFRLFLSDEGREDTLNHLGGDREGEYANLRPNMAIQMHCFNGGSGNILVNPYLGFFPCVWRLLG